MRLAIPLLILSATLACFASRGLVSHYVNPEHDLSLYRTWEWDEVSGPAEPELDAEIREAIEREFLARGYQRADGHWPELRVSYRLALHREVELHTEHPATQFVASMHNAPSFEVGTSEQRARIYETGTLSLRVDRPVEADSSWWAVQSTRARFSFAREASRAVELMFRTFPATSAASAATETTERDGSVDWVASTP